MSLKSGHISPKQLNHFATFYEPYKFTTTSIHTPRLALGVERQGVKSLEILFASSSENLLSYWDVTHSP